MRSKSKQVFLDFDGTLIDPRRRLYRLFQELVPESDLDFTSYWNIKRNRTNQQALLGDKFGYSTTQIAAFKKTWMEQVEREDRLLLDEPIPHAGEILQRLKQDGHRICLATARQKPELVQAQIIRFGWDTAFDAVLVTGQADTKENLILRHGAVDVDDVFIGDTGEDIQTAKGLGIKSISVTTGFLSADILKEYNPDYICESVAHIYETGLL